jgi:hypothetical protein
VTVTVAAIEFDALKFASPEYAAPMTCAHVVNVVNRGERRESRGAIGAAVGLQNLVDVTAFEPCLPACKA